jgi:hypothetical protein
MVGVPFRQEQSSLLVACRVSATAILGNGGMKKELDHRGAFRHSFLTLTVESAVLALSVVTRP